MFCFFSFVNKCDRNMKVDRIKKREEESERVESPYQITIAVSLSVKQDSMKIVVSCQCQKRVSIFLFYLFLLMVHVVYYWMLSY